MLKYNNLIGLALLLCCFCIMSTSSIKLNQVLDLVRDNVKITTVYEPFVNPKPNGTANTKPSKKKAMEDPLFLKKRRIFGLKTIQ